MSGADVKARHYCGKCGAEVPLDDSFCPKCAASLLIASYLNPNSTPRDWHEERHERIAERRAERLSRPGPHFGGLIIATILIVAGLGIFFPQLPWQAFWGTILIIAGLWIVYLWVTRNSRYKIDHKPAS
jgi:ribosomal protein S27AE